MQSKNATSPLPLSFQPPGLVFNVILRVSKLVPTQ